MEAAGHRTHDAPTADALMKTRQSGSRKRAMNPFRWVLVLCAMRGREGGSRSGAEAGAGGDIRGSTGDLGSRRCGGTHWRRWRKNGRLRVEMQLRDAWTGAAEMRESGAVAWGIGSAKSHHR